MSGLFSLNCSHCCSHWSGIMAQYKSVCVFQILHVMQDQHGRYRCEISSSTERLWTNEVDVVIGMLRSSAFFLQHCYCSSVKPAVLSLRVSDYLLCSWLKAPRISVQISGAMECSEGRVEKGRCMVYIIALGLRLSAWRC